MKLFPKWISEQCLELLWLCSSLGSHFLLWMIYWGDFRFSTSKLVSSYSDKFTEAATNWLCKMVRQKWSISPRPQKAPYRGRSTTPRSSDLPSPSSTPRRAWLWWQTESCPLGLWWWRCTCPSETCTSARWPRLTRIWGRLETAWSSRRVGGTPKSWIIISKRYLKNRFIYGISQGKNCWYKYTIEKTIVFGVIINLSKFQLSWESIVQRAITRWEAIPEDTSKCGLDPVNPAGLEQTIVLFWIWTAGIITAILILSAEFVYQSYIECVNEE